MSDVIATQRGFYGNVLREVGDRFEIEDEIMSDPKRRPSWVAPAKFGGKGDHDGDGKPGGSKPETAAEKKAREKAERSAAKAEPFADAPEPIEVRGNGVKEALPVEPDWVAPQPIED